MRTDDCEGLFPPKDFIPTAIFWGLGAAGIMAGVNMIRLSLAAQGRRLIALMIVLQCIVWGVWGLLLYISPKSVVTMEANRGLPGIEVFSMAVWMIPAVMILNGAVGYWLYKTQSVAYLQWISTHPRGTTKNPYLKWWVPLAALLCAGMVILLFCLALGCIR